MTVRYYPPLQKFDRELLMSHWICKIFYNDKKRINEKEKESSSRLSNVMISEKILDDGFCKNVFPKIVDNYASLVEQNAKKFQQEMKELRNYELWHLTPWQWSYEI